ncbi:MAG: ABC transporter ATP-binding protein [Pseudomonadota bacterium]
MAEALLDLRALTAGYGETVVLHDVSLALGAGESLALLGRNGVGKTSLLATIMGHTRLHRGELRLGGRAITALPSYARARAGLGYVPQEREIFPSLSVLENLEVAEHAGVDGTKGWSVARVFEMFPRLAERRDHRGNQLSGGEQQMLAIGRALMGNPTLLLLDEPLEGLAPIIVENLMAALQRLRQAEGLAMILVEQHAMMALEFAPRALVLDRGRVVHDGPSRDLANDPPALGRLIGVVG